MSKSQLINSLKKQGFSDKILNAFSKIKREDFIQTDLKQYAYEDKPLPIGYGATISQPYTIAFMLNLLELDKLNNLKTLKYNDTKISKLGNEGIRRLRVEEKDLNSNSKTYNKILDNKDKTKILEIGSGSGYVLALMNEISKNSKIYGVERIEGLVEKSSNVLRAKKNIAVFCGDGSKGLKKYAPYNRILISASAEKIPSYLCSQLKDNGIIVCPVKNSIFQIKRKGLRLEKKEFRGFMFVPLIED